MREAAYERAVRQHKDGLHGFASQMLRDREEALDVAQEAMIRLWEQRKRVEPERARAWLMRTAHNLCIDRIRRRKTRNEVADGDDVVQWRESHEPDPARLAESSALGRQLERTLGELDATDRAVIVMREIQELPYREIAEVMQMPLGTVKARLHRARERLRERLLRAGAAPTPGAAGGAS